MGAFEDMTLMTWTPAGGFPIPIHATRITGDFEAGLVKRRRAFKPGAKIDNTAPEPRVFTVEVPFIAPNASDTDGAFGEVNSYPDDLNALEASAEIQDTGTLLHPRRGQVRCQIKSFKVVEDAENRDSAAATIVFWEDNEDTTTSASFQPTARSAATPIAQQIVDECEAAGVWNNGLAELRTFAEQLEELASSPTEYVDDIDAQATAVVAICAEVLYEFADTSLGAADETTRLLTDPRYALIGRLMRRLIVLCIEAREVRAAERAQSERVFPAGSSIFQIAIDLEQELDTLLRLNPGLPNPFYFPTDTTIRFEVAA